MRARGNQHKRCSPATPIQFQTAPSSKLRNAALPASLSGWGRITPPSQRPLSNVYLLDIPRALRRSSICPQMYTTPQPARAVSEAIATIQRVAFRGGIGGEHNAFRRVGPSAQACPAPSLLFGSAQALPAIRLDPILDPNSQAQPGPDSASLAFE
jgi:hypothetical protein